MNFKKDSEMISNSQKQRSLVIYTVLSGWFVLIALWKCLAISRLVEDTALSQNLWWGSLILLGAMLTGFLFQPLTKMLFPGLGDERVKASPALHLKDHETLMGYYPVVTVVVFLGALLLSTILYGEQIVFVVKSSYFWPASIGSGLLNVGIFYFFTKGLRYGDISLISVIQGLNPVVALPISLAVFALLKSVVPITNPSIGLYGMIGILITVGALAINGFTQKKKVGAEAPEGDWFAHHPVFSAVLSTIFAGFAINFDKVAVDAGNPFLAGIVTMGTVALVTILWTLFQSGKDRIIYIIRNYWRAFLAVGLVYGLVIIIFNVTLFEHNVNYYGTIKRASVVFGTIWGLYVLKEGINAKEKAVRLGVSVSIILGALLILLKG